MNSIQVTGLEQHNGSAQLDPRLKYIILRRKSRDKIRSIYAGTKERLGRGWIQRMKT